MSKATNDLDRRKKIEVEQKIAVWAVVCFLYTVGFHLLTAVWYLGYLCIYL